MPDEGDALAWDPALILVSALKKLGTNATAAQIQQYISSLTAFEGIDGTYNFTASQPDNRGLTIKWTRHQSQRVEADWAQKRPSGPRWPLRRRSSGTSVRRSEASRQMWAVGNIIIGGLITGAIYALLAVGYSLVFSVSGALNLAQGAFVALGALTMYTFTHNAHLACRWRVPRLARGRRWPRSASSSGSSSGPR